MRWDDLPGYVVLLLAMTAMGLAARGRAWELVGPLMAATALHPLIGRWVVWRWVPGPNRKGEPPLLPAGAVGIGLFCLPFAALTQVWEISGRSGLGLNLPWHTSLTLLAFAVWKLYAPWNRRRFGVVVFSSASALATCGADVSNDHYLALVVPFALAALIGLRLHMPQDVGRTQGRLRWAAVAVAVVLTGIVTSAGSVLVRNNVDAARQAVRRMTRTLDILPDSPGGFSDQARLGDITGDVQAGGRTVALRARSIRAPGYLRGRGFLRYEDGAWTSSKDGHLYVGKSDAPGWAHMPGQPRVPEGVELDHTIHTSPRYAAHLFVPLQTAALETPGRLLSLHPASTVKATGLSSAKGYGVLLSAQPIRAEQDRADYRALPDGPPELLAALEAKAKLLRLSPDQSPRRLAERIEEHFAEAYRYQVGIAFDDERDPLAQFLSEKSHGHCELFASAGTLLLRSQGVRARYVTGFVCGEPSTWDPQLWIARNEHAHAWVELYDPERGWQTVEFTPGSGQPPNVPASGSEAFLDWLGGQWERLRGLIAREGLGGLLQGLGTLLKEFLLWVVSSPWRVGFFIAVVLLYGLFRFLRDRLPQRRAAARAVRELSPTVAAARERYLALEARLAKQGLGRGDGETLLEYGARLQELEALEEREAIVEQVRVFAALRYGPEA